MAQDVIRNELLVLAETNGILRAEDVVNAARPPQSKLHSYFEWDDSIAAEEYRLAQARRLIRVTVEYLDDKNNIPQPIFVSLKRDRTQAGGGYRALVEVISNDELYRELLEQAMKDYDNFRRKYENLRELKPLFRIGDRIREENGTDSTA